MSTTRSAALVIALVLVTSAAHADKHVAAPAARTPAVDPASRDYAAALAALSDGHPRIAADLLRRVLDTHPEHDDARLLLGELMLDEGKGAEARIRLQLGFDARPARFGLPLARAMLAMDDPEAALQLLHAMPTPAEGEAWRFALIGHAAQASGRNDEAIDAFRAALALEPRQRSWTLELSRCLQTAGRTEEAFAALETPMARDGAGPVEREPIGLAPGTGSTTP